MPDPDAVRLDGVHVLVVDDDEDTRDLLELYLANRGATVTTARSGGEAVAMVSESGAHVIISDISMPGMSGLEFMRRVRDLPGQAAKRTPAIAFTALRDQVHRTEALASGFHVYLLKPLAPRMVAQEVARLHREGQAGAA
jgi:CheY-like chemotaxis protein